VSFILKLLPQTVTSQLMTLVAIALIFAQAINLYILVDERRFRARADIINTALNDMVQQTRHLPSLSTDELPIELSGPGSRDGHFYLSNRSQVKSYDPQYQLTGYSDKLTTLLKKNQVDFASAAVAIVPIKDRADDDRSRNAKALSPHRNDRRKLRPPPRNVDDPPRRRPPPPSGSKGPKKGPAVSEIVISIELKPGIWLNAIRGHAPVEALTPKILFATGALLAIALLSMAFFMRRISRPLSQFSHAADEFGRGNDPGVLAEDGPQDVRQAAKAFNRMQRRLSRTLETQRTMLRAVGHDLRTPLTSLRIRAEMIPEELHREKFIATIDEMTEMTEEILDWAKNASALETVASVDLRALLSSIVDDFSDQGEDITLTDFESTTLNIRRMAIKRALINVIGNALKYASDTKISVSQSHSSIDIHVDDTGPGIPEEMINDALKPFVRLESSRNKDSGGTGLGLSIAETIIQAEGGKLIIKNRQPRGLRVTLCLPI